MGVQPGMAQVTAVGHARGTGQPVPWQLGSLHSRVTQGTGEGLDEGSPRWTSL